MLSSLKQQSTGIHIALPVHFILITNQPVFARTPWWCVLSRTAANIILIVFGFTPIYWTPSEHAYQYTINVFKSSVFQLNSWRLEKIQKSLFVLYMCIHIHVFFIYYAFPQLNLGPSWLWSYGSWIYNYLCNQCLSSLMLWVRISIRARCTTLSDKVCQWHATGLWFFSRSSGFIPQHD